MKLRVYVAGASKDLERAERAMTWLREAGCEITTDWVAEMKAEPLADRELTLERQQRCATADLLGVIRADVVWFLVPSEPVRSTGLWSELGAATVLDVLATEFRITTPRPRLIASCGPAAGFNIFLSLVEVVTGETVLEADVAAFDRILAP